MGQQVSPDQPLLACPLGEPEHAVQLPGGQRKLFPTDDSAKKVIHLAIQAASKKWTMPIRHWKPALNRFMIEFVERLAVYI